MSSYGDKRGDEIQPRRDWEREKEDAPERRDPQHDPQHEPDEGEPMIAREAPDFDRDDEDNPDEGITEERAPHPAVEEERRRQRRDGVYI